MDTTTFLAILGIVATFIFGFLSIDLFKRKKNPGKLTLIKHSVIGLFNNIAKNFDEISIQYKGEAIKENVIYLKASIINDGDLDIDGKTIEKTINLNLKTELKWIKAKVTETSPDLNCETIIENNQSDLKFNFGLIRKKEFFQFEALIETLKKEQKAENIFDEITITHRIANTQKIKRAILLSEEQMVKKKKKMKSFAINVGTQFLIVFGLLLAQIFYFKSAPIQYKSKENITYEAKATSDNQIKLTDTKTDKEIYVLIDEFQKEGNYIPFIPNQTFLEKIKGFYYILPVMLILLLVLTGWEYMELRKSYKLYDIFSKSEEK
jgi:hypothetical protein